MRINHQTIPFEPKTLEIENIATFHLPLNYPAIFRDQPNSRWRFTTFRYLERGPAADVNCEILEFSFSRTDKKNDETLVVDIFPDRMTSTDFETMVVVSFVDKGQFARKMLILKNKQGRPKGIEVL